MANSGPRLLISSARYTIHPSREGKPPHWTGSRLDRETETTHLANMNGFEVACIPASPLLVARLHDAVGPTGRIRVCPDSTAALLLIVRGEIDATVVAVDERTATQALTTLRQLRAALPAHAVIAWCDYRRPPSRLLLDIAQTGVTELLLRDVDDAPKPFADVLASAVQRSSARLLEERFSPLIAAPVRPVFHFALEHANEPLSVDAVAAAFGITRRTLRNRLVEHHLPAPRVFLTWCRVLVAGALLDERARSLDAVAGTLDFPSGHGLGMVLRRYLGSGINVLRHGQVSAAVETAFRAALQHTASAARARREATNGSLPLDSSAD